MEINENHKVQLRTVAIFYHFLILGTQVILIYCHGLQRKAHMFAWLNLISNF